MQPLKITIQPFTSDCTNEIIELLEDNDLPFEDIDFSKTLFFVAEYNSSFAGVIGLEVYGGHALLRSLAVNRKLRGKTIGHELVNYLLLFCKKEWIDEVFLLTTSAEGFFESLGFNVIDRDSVPEAIKQASEFRYICPTTSTVMHKYVT